MRFDAVGDEHVEIVQHRLQAVTLQREVQVEGASHACGAQGGVDPPRPVLGVEIVHQSNRNFVDEVCGFHAYRFDFARAPLMSMCIERVDGGFIHRGPQGDLLRRLFVMETVCSFKLHFQNHSCIKGTYRQFLKEFVAIMRVETGRNPMDLTVNMDAKIKTRS